MGWDAHSSADIIIRRNKVVIKDPRLRKIFADAREEVKKLSGGIADGFLDMGSLDCSSCAEALEKATGESCWSDPWDVDTVIILNQAADWNFEFDKEYHWAYWSARKFLEICAREGLSIKFTW